MKMTRRTIARNQELGFLPLVTTLFSICRRQMFTCLIHFDHSAISSERPHPTQRIKKMLENQSIDKKEISLFLMQLQRWLYWLRGPERDQASLPVAELPPSQSHVYLCFFICLCLCHCYQASLPVAAVQKSRLQKEKLEVIMTQIYLG